MGELVLLLGLFLGFIGLISILIPLKFLKIKSRKMGLGVLFVGLGVFILGGLSIPTPPVEAWVENSAPFSIIAEVEDDFTINSHEGFIIRVNGKEEEINSVNTDNGKMLFTLSNAIKANDKSITIEYNNEINGDDDSSILESFEAINIKNKTFAPKFNKAYISEDFPNLVVVLFNDQITSIHDEQDELGFKINVNDQIWPIDSAQIEENRIIFNLSERINYNDKISISYNELLGKIIDTHGAQNSLTSFKNKKVDNRLPKPETSREITTTSIRKISDEQPSTTKVTEVLESSVQVSETTKAMNTISKDTEKIEEKELDTTLKYEVNTSVIPEGAGIIVGSGIYKKGEKVTLTIEEAKGYEFEKWLEKTRPSGGFISFLKSLFRTDKVLSTNKEYSFIANDDIYIVAEFKVLPKHEVIASVIPDEAGIVIGSGTYIEGEYITLKAKAEEKYEFENWIDETGEVLSTNKEYAFIVKENLKLSAVFNAKAADYSQQEEEMAKKIKQFIDEFFFFNDMNFDYIENFTVNMIGNVIENPEEVYVNVHLNLEKWEEIDPNYKVHISWFAGAIIGNLVYQADGVDYFIDEIRIITKNFNSDKQHIEKLLLTGIEIKPILPSDYFITENGELFVIYKTWISKTEWQKRRQ